MAELIDLRSDTVTRPTPEMRAAMAAVEVGDDVYGEDPTVNLLESRAAAIFGREAALFVPTGTMGNQIALRLLTQPGQEIICESRAHILDYEMATAAVFSGCLIRAVATKRGTLTWKDIEPVIYGRGTFRASTGCVEVENTANLTGGRVTPLPVMEEIWTKAKERKLGVHLDGARIYRKALGGGMRQAGVLAAAGLIALETMPARLHEDHANARLLAEALSHMDGVSIDLSSVETNIVIFRLTGALSATELVARLKAGGILASTVGPDAIRLVTHNDV